MVATFPVHHCSKGTRGSNDLSVLRAFGTKCHYLLTLQKKGGKKMALHEKGRLGVILGIEGNMPAYRIMDLETRDMKRIPFAQTVSHEGHYPLGDKYADVSADGQESYLDEDAVDLVPWNLFRARPATSSTPAAPVPDMLVHTPATSTPVVEPATPAPAPVSTMGHMAPAPVSIPTAPAPADAAAPHRTLRGG